MRRDIRRSRRLPGRARREFVGLEPSALHIALLLWWQGSHLAWTTALRDQAAATASRCRPAHLRSTALACEHYEGHDLGVRDVHARLPCHGILHGMAVEIP